VLGDSIGDDMRADSLQEAIREVYKDRRPIVWHHVDIRKVSIKVHDSLHPRLEGAHGLEFWSGGSGRSILRKRRETSATDRRFS